MCYCFTRVIVWQNSRDHISVYERPTMINALALTRAQICPKLNGKLFDSHDNIRLLRNNAKLFRNVAIYVASKFRREIIIPGYTVSLALSDNTPIIFARSSEPSATDEPTNCIFLTTRATLPSQNYSFPTHNYARQRALMSRLLTRSRIDVQSECSWLHSIAITRLRRVTTSRGVRSGSEA